MSILKHPSGKRPLRWAWWVVIPVVLVALLCVFFGTHLRRELIIRHLEAEGVEFQFETIQSHPLQLVPGLERYHLPVWRVKIRITNEKESANLPQLLRDVSAFGGHLTMDLSGSDDLVRDLKQLPAGRVFDLVVVGDRRITANALQHLSGNTALQGLSLIGCQLDNRALAQIGQLKQLVKLELECSSITDEGMRQLHGLTSLRHVTLGNTRVSETAQQELSKALPNLGFFDD